VGSLQLSFHLVQTSSYDTAPDQSKVVLRIRAMCRQYRRQKAYNRGGFEVLWGGSTGIFRCDFFTFEFYSVKSFRNQIAIEYLHKFVLLQAENIEVCFYVGRRVVATLTVCI